MSVTTAGQEWFLIIPMGRVWLEIWAGLRNSRRVNYFLSTYSPTDQKRLEPHPRDTKP